MKWLILLLGIAANASASVLVKLAMMPPRSFPSLGDPRAAIANWPFWLGLGLYGAAFLLYAAALARLPLNVAHPVLTSGAIATVAVLSVVLFGEAMHWTRAAGLVLVTAGVVMLTLRAE
jgi:multidrug transporter EmrE-like cation transporter